MDKSKLEKFISYHRRELDQEEVPNHLWKRIEEQSFQPITKDYSWIWKAASISFFVISVGLGSYLYFQPTNPPELSLGQFSEELRVLETNYLTEIEQLQSELVLDDANKIAIEWLLEELEFVDAIKKDLQSESKDGIPENQVISILMNYYEKKLKILKRIELELNRQNHEKNRSIRS